MSSPFTWGLPAHSRHNTQSPPIRVHRRSPSPDSVAERPSRSLSPAYDDHRRTRPRHSRSPSSPYTHSRPSFHDRGHETILLKRPARDYEGSHGSTYRNSVAAALSKTDLTAFQDEFKEFYKRAYEAGIRTGALWDWATEAVADELSGGKTKFIILNGSYMTKSFSDPLKRKIDEVLISVDRGTLSIDPSDDHGVLVSALLLLGAEVDAKLRAQAGGATPDTVLDGGPPSSRDDFRFRFKYDTGNVEDRGESEERKRLLRLGLDAGAGEGEARLCYVEIPLRADWDVVERDGIEEITVL
ncbi:hypothetical protein RQP46_008837 [Phenoliferia psychrophenolica]